MEPIAFPSHCASCHSNTLVYDVARFRDAGIPHGVQPELLRGLIRERYTQFIHQNAGELEGDEARAQRPIPGRPGRRPAAEAEWAWVGLQVEKADYILFQSSSGCRYCHGVEASEKSWHIAPTAIPMRWLVHSQFSHFSHRHAPKPSGENETRGKPENCTECHELAERSAEDRRRAVATHRGVPQMP